jgi:hypothetical protein
MFDVKEGLNEETRLRTSEGRMAYEHYTPHNDSWGPRIVTLLPGATLPAIIPNPGAGSHACAKKSVFFKHFSFALF